MWRGYGTIWVSETPETRCERPLFAYLQASFGDPVCLCIEPIPKYDVVCLRLAHSAPDLEHDAQM